MNAIHLLTRRNQTEANARRLQAHNEKVRKELERKYEEAKQNIKRGKKQ